MFKYTKHFLKKTEDLFEELDYEVRYERGTFQSGYCMVEDRKMVIINKFFDTEARINTLIEILNTLPVNADVLSTEGKILYNKLVSTPEPTALEELSA